MTEAGITNIQPNIKLAKSPTNAVDVPFKKIFKRILTASITTPAHGPKRKEPIITGISLKSNS